jgi:hypothetical protein
MTTLLRLAERFDVAVLAIRHFRKSDAPKALLRGLGSIDFSAAVRSILVAGEHPTQQGLRVLAHAKSNLAAKGPSQTYEITVEGEFRWAGSSTVTANELASFTAAEKVTKREEAKDFLTELLAQGPVDYQKVSESAKAEGISPKTLNRAKKDLGVRSEHVGESGQQGGGQWFWSLPCQGGHVANSGLDPLANEDARRLVPGLGGVTREI